MAYVGPTESALSLENTVPPRLSGWHYNTWKLADPRKAATAVKLAVQDGIQKRDWYQLIVEL
jgi:hypothetical protein